MPTKRPRPMIRTKKQYLKYKGFQTPQMSDMPKATTKRPTRTWTPGRYGQTTNVEPKFPVQDERQESVQAAQEISNYKPLSAAQMALGGVATTPFQSTMPYSNWKGRGGYVGPTNPNIAPALEPVPTNLVQGGVISWRGQQYIIRPISDYQNQVMVQRAGRSGTPYDVGPYGSVTNQSIPSGSVVQGNLVMVPLATSSETIDKGERDKYVKPGEHIVRGLHAQIAGVTAEPIATNTPPQGTTPNPNGQSNQAGSDNGGYDYGGYGWGGGGGYSSSSYANPWYRYRPGQANPAAAAPGAMQMRAITSGPTSQYATQNGAQRWLQLLTNWRI